MKYVIAVQIYGFLMLSKPDARFRNFVFYFCKFLSWKIGILRVFPHSRQLQNQRFWQKINSFLGTLAEFPWHETCRQRYKLLLIISCLRGCWHWTSITVAMCCRN